jgi:hypothetical protein
VELLVNQSGLEIVQVTVDLAAIGNPFAIQSLEGDFRRAEDSLRRRDIDQCLGQQNQVCLLHWVEVRTKVVLLVLLHQPLQVTKWGVEPDHDVPQPSLVGGPPALLAAHDLVVARSDRRRFDLKEGIVPTRFDRGGEPTNHLHGGVHARLDRTRMDLINWYQRKVGRLRANPRVLDRPVAEGVKR